MKVLVTDSDGMYPRAMELLHEDERKGIELLQKATEEGGHLRAMEQLAFIYENGKHGVAADSGVCC